MFVLYKLYQKDYFAFTYHERIYVENILNHDTTEDLVGYLRVFW